MEGVIPAGPLAATVSSSLLLAVDEQSQVGAARRCAVALARELDLGREALGRLAIVVTEAATNIVRHAGTGVIILRPLNADAAFGMEVLALDKGPGIADVPRAMGDGFSSSGTAGQGLGAMQRLSDMFDIYSRRGAGTAIVARVMEGPRLASDEKSLSIDDCIGAVSIPFRGEIACGDAWRVTRNGQRLSALLVDGLGHGAGAAGVAQTAVTRFAQLAPSNPTDNTIQALDLVLRGSRGAAASVVVIDELGRQTSFSGVGNVDGRVLFGPDSRHLVPQNGIVGHTMPTVKLQSGAWPENARLVLHSDGLSARWRMDAYPGLLGVHPALLAGVLYRDFARTNDDATVLVIADGVTRDRS